MQVLTPRVKAFHCALNALQEHAAAVYDATIVYEEKTEPVARKLPVACDFNYGTGLKRPASLF